MKILVVSTYPPTHCGIAAYAKQTVEKLRSEGNDVFVASPNGQGDVDYKLDLCGGLKFLKLLKYYKKFDKIILQYNAESYLNHKRGKMYGVVLPNFALILFYIFFKKVEVVCHEFEKWPKRGFKLILYTLTYIKWRCAARILFHTKEEIDNFLEYYPIKKDKIGIKEHIQDFIRFTDSEKEEARQELGLPYTEKIFLCIGFIQPSKGFDIAAMIFNKLKPQNAKLYIVGSVRVDLPENKEYLVYLNEICKESTCVNLVIKFVSDKEFDNWISAADYVVLPYRQIWSSGVLARAKLYKKIVIAYNIGGLGGQIKQGDYLYNDDFELKAIIKNILSTSEQGKLNYRKKLSISSDDKKMGKLAFVNPWFPDGAGAEIQCLKTAQNLALRGYEVEVLTTCIKSYYDDWGTNYYKEGTYYLDDLKVRRFNVYKRNRDKFDELNNKLMNGNLLLHDEEQLFISEMVKCQRLCEYISINKNDYDFFIFTPYMVSTSYWGSISSKGKSIFIPCLHNESYARLNIYKQMFSNSEGLFLYSKSEMLLAKKLYNLPDSKVFLTGGGIDCGINFNPWVFKKKYNIDNYMLYVGRKDDGKNFPLLLEYFRKYKHRNNDNFKLVIIGPGKFISSPVEENYIIDLGFIPEEDKFNAYSQTKFLCQPSTKESFSIVMMEAWLTGAPVLVHEKCNVTKEHCVESNGGLYFGNYEEFEACVNLLRFNEKLREKLGENGRCYVSLKYNWDKIVENYEDAFNKLKDKS